jgi:hypothetical protein
MTAVRVLAQVLELVHQVPAGEFPWFRKTLRELLYMSGSTPVQNEPLEPVHEPVLNLVHEPVHELVQERSKASFEKFWSIYPRKQAKKEALRIWLKLNVDSNALNQILSSVQTQMNSVQWRDEPRFIPLPKTWLNQARWADEPLVRVQQVHRSRDPNHFPGCQCQRCSHAIDNGGAG